LSNQVVVLATHIETVVGTDGESGRLAKAETRLDKVWWAMGLIFGIGLLLGFIGLENLGKLFAK
jgi:hypothetical protein